jgi:hypothetical protein
MQSRFGNRNQTLARWGVLHIWAAKSEERQTEEASTVAERSNNSPVAMHIKMHSRGWSEPVIGYRRVVISETPPSGGNRKAGKAKHKFQSASLSRYLWSTKPPRKIHTRLHAAWMTLVLGKALWKLLVISHSTLREIDFITITREPRMAVQACLRRG